jgi:hypothetical protein
MIFQNRVRSAKMQEQADRGVFLHIATRNDTQGQGSWSLDAPNCNPRNRGCQHVPRQNLSRSSHHSPPCKRSLPQACKPTVHSGSLADRGSRFGWPVFAPTAGKSRPRSRSPAHSFSSSIGLRSTPTPSISTSQTSPARMNTGGLRAKPTPDGVPVTMMSPGSSVIAWVR